MVSNISSCIFQARKAKKNRELFDFLRERGRYYLKLCDYDDAIRDFKEQKSIADCLSMSSTRRIDVVFNLGRFTLLNAHYELKI